MGTATPWTAKLHIVGLAVFFAGFAVFVGTLGLGDYRVTDRTTAAIDQSPVVRDQHHDALLAELGRLEGRSYASIFSVMRAVDGVIDAADSTLPDEARIWDYERGEYRFAIVRETSLGIFPGGVSLFFWLSLGLACLGGIIAFLAQALGSEPGVKNDGVMTASATSRGWIGISLGVFMIAFYVVLYFQPVHVVNWIRLADPVSQALRGQPASRWFFYGLLYTLAVVVMGVRMLVKYRHSRYHLVRTASVIFFQLGFAFLIPEILAVLNRPAADLKNAWPLDYDFFYSWNLEALLGGGAFGWFILVWGIALALLVVPLFAYFFGKRWYCSWVCGCGGLAETLGDPFRQLSSKRLKAWRLERWLVHAVLVFAVILTVVVLVNFFSARSGQPLLGELTWRLQQWYGFLISSIFAGVVGTGFYPILGNRVWCRFGCPLAAILGIVQRFKSRFRITVNGGQCISCGNCSTYCEMGIDVRWYAQRGQNFARASCVGCGVCSTVCPRGVLRLENGPEEGRFTRSGLVGVEWTSPPS